MSTFFLVIHYPGADLQRQPPLRNLPHYGLLRNSNDSSILPVTTGIPVVVRAAAVVDRGAVGIRLVDIPHGGSVGGGVFVLGRCNDDGGGFLGGRSSGMLYRRRRVTRGLGVGARAGFGWREADIKNITSKRTTNAHQIVTGADKITGRLSVGGQRPKYFCCFEDLKQDLPSCAAYYSGYVFILDFQYCVTVTGCIFEDRAYLQWCH